MFANYIYFSFFQSPPKNSSLNFKSIPGKNKFFKCDHILMVHGLDFLLFT